MNNKSVLIIAVIVIMSLSSLSSYLSFRDFYLRTTVWPCGIGCTFVIKEYFNRESKLLMYGEWAEVQNGQVVASGSWTSNSRDGYNHKLVFTNPEILRNQNLLVVSNKIIDFSLAIQNGPVKIYDYLGNSYFDSELSDKETFNTNNIENSLMIIVYYNENKQLQSFKLYTGDK